MKRILILVGGALVVSLALNIFLSSRLAKQGARLKSPQGTASEIDELVRQYEDLKINKTTASNSEHALRNELAQLRRKVSELARLRNETAQLRRQLDEAAHDAGGFRALLVGAAEDLTAVESELAEALTRSPEEWQQKIQEEKSDQCASHLRRIGMGALLWAADHNNAFPPDIISMQMYLHSPEILFCPADPSAIRVFIWEHLNPALISYAFFNLNSSKRDAANLLAACPFHGHFVLGDIVLGDIRVHRNEEHVP
jgi:hypothetical protein